MLDKSSPSSIASEVASSSRPLETIEASGIMICGRGKNWLYDVEEERSLVIPLKTYHGFYNSKLRGSGPKNLLIQSAIGTEPLGDHSKYAV